MRKDKTIAVLVDDFEKPEVKGAFSIPSRVLKRGCFGGSDGKVAWVRPMFGPSAEGWDAFGVQ
jgi:hypothetical protein